MKLKVTQIRSTIGRKEDQKRTIAALGLGKINRSRLHDDNPVIRGMIYKVTHLVKVEEIEGAAKKTATKAKPKTPAKPKVKAVEKETSVKETSAPEKEKADVKKTAAKKTTAKKTTTKKAAEKKPAVKKTAPKKAAAENVEPKAEKE